MPTLWDAFLEDYNQEIWDWTLRETLETFWYFCQDGHKSVHEWQERIKKMKETQAVGSTIDFDCMMGSELSQANPASVY